MKEYWVNVYYDSDKIWYGKPYKTGVVKPATVFANYRLHVREFESREAKELYLKMKYGGDLTKLDWMNDKKVEYPYNFNYPGNGRC